MSIIYTTLTKAQLLKEYQKAFKTIERSMKAREKASDWRYQTGYTYDLYKELYKTEDNLDFLSNPSSHTSSQFK